MNITTNATDVAESLRIIGRQIAYAGRDALKATAKSIMLAESRKVKKVFDNPVRATQNAFRISKGATLKDLSTVVSVKDKIGKGNAPAQWLKPQVLGGVRRNKRNEKALRSVIGYRGQALPAFDYPRDSFGNVPGKVYTRAIKSLREKKKGEGAFFRGRGKHRNIIYEKTKKADGGKVRPFLILFPRAHYHRRFHFFKVARKQYGREMLRNFSRNIERNLRDAHWK